jgi:hypothetical protein
MTLKRITTFSATMARMDEKRHGVRGIVADFKELRPCRATPITTAFFAVACWNVWKAAMPMALR